MNQPATAGPSSVSSPVARRAMIEQRRRGSALWRAIHLLGSLQLALLLLAAIAIACAVATFYESGFNAKIAQHYIYKAPWFVFWLGLLCVNLFAVTLTRWPWQKKHIGFVITHYGIIVLLAGAFVGSQWGFEGNVTLHKERPPATRVTTSRSIIQIDNPGSGQSFIKSFDASVTRPSAAHPRRLPVPGTDWRVVVTDATDDLARGPVIQSDPGGSPAAILRLRSEVAGRAQIVALQLDGGEPAKDSLFGMAEIELVRQLPAATVAEAVENRMVFAGYAPVAQGPASGLEIQLARDGTTVRMGFAGATSATYRVGEILGKEVPVGAALVTLREFWPDFEMRDGKPATRSELPRNPAVLASIRHHGEAAGPASAATPKLRLEVAPDGAALNYQLLRGAHVVAQDTIRPGAEFATGWNDWSAELLQVSAGGRLVEEVGPAGRIGAAGESGIPGFLAVLEAGPEASGEPVWVESGSTTTLSAGPHSIRLGYGLKLRPLSFTIRLLDFEVPRLEGTTTPANFIATVEFFDPKTGARKQDQARMNRPANWPGGWWGLLSGQNYKFSQAEWNPQDLGETTLQVLYDPGWLLKWIGSLGICVGIGLLFYWKPAGTGAKQAVRPQRPEAAAAPHP